MVPRVFELCFVRQRREAHRQRRRAPATICAVFLSGAKEKRFDGCFLLSNKQFCRPRICFGWPGHWCRRTSVTLISTTCRTASRDSTGDNANRASALTHPPSPLPQPTGICVFVMLTWRPLLEIKSLSWVLQFIFHFSWCCSRPHQRHGWMFQQRAVWHFVEPVLKRTTRFFRHSSPAEPSFLRRQFSSSAIDKRKANRCSQASANRGTG